MFNLGYQFPRNGENMAGLYLFDLNDQNYREYAEVELEQELENKYYSFSIYVSPGEQGLGYENYSNCLQAHFSENKVTASYYYVLNVEPQWKNLEMITDTSGWVKLEGTFKANGGERFITIGCFDDSASIVVDNHDPFTTSDIYYFLDDANLSEAAFSIHFPNVFSPNGDGINDIFLPEIVHVPDYEVYIYNRWGNLMTILSESTPGWDGAEAQEGTYFYVLEKESLNIKEQGFFQLVRS
jgi:gliding motility-associated-like protein